VKVVNNPESCTDNSQVTTTGAPNSPIAKAEARIEGEKVKGWVGSVVLALSIMVNVVLFSMYLNAQHTVVDAYRDIKTQVWVRQDKDEERFQKFVAGPYADLAGEVRASQILFSKCKESR
jgi:hypothetical protein